MVLELTPSTELNFSHVADTAPVRLYNPSLDTVAAFKVKTTAPKHYIVRPNSGLVHPGQQATIHVTACLQTDLDRAQRGKDKFLIESVLLSSREIRTDLLTLWPMLDPARIQEHRLRARFPFTVPSPPSYDRQNGSNNTLYGSIAPGSFPRPASASMYDPPNPQYPGSGSRRGSGASASGYPRSMSDPSLGAYPPSLPRTTANGGAGSPYPSANRSGKGYSPSPSPPPLIRHADSARDVHNPYDSLATVTPGDLNAVPARVARLEAQCARLADLVHQLREVVRRIDPTCNLGLEPVWVEDDVNSLNESGFFGAPNGYTGSFFGGGGGSGKHGGGRHHSGNSKSGILGLGLLGSAGLVLGVAFFGMILGLVVRIL
ncbi:PapD-like protein [Blastocladiella britannica]|nr:PapD-like protein [Blastocladiella britannica]